MTTYDWVICQSNDTMLLIYNCLGLIGDYDNAWSRFLAWQKMANTTANHRKFLKKGYTRHKVLITIEIV